MKEQDIPVTDSTGKSVTMKPPVTIGSIAFRCKCCDKPLPSPMPQSSTITIRALVGEEVLMAFRYCAPLCDDCMPKIRLVVEGSPTPTENAERK